jgi:GxxExxY protein
MINKKYLHSQLTFDIIGCAMEVHRTLGCGYAEIIYQRALAIELESRGYFFECEYNFNVVYKGHSVGKQRVDFYVEKQVIVELKAVYQLEGIHISQAINYLNTSEIDVGLVLNFGNESLQYKRIMRNTINA